ncbi:MAG: N-acetylmuramoyl-L-alanine amidase [Ignavibacteria bacterium]|nr:N-acetylmuramoyl-L-alanine amidase [Ignavibacteria bacterium]
MRWTKIFLFLFTILFISGCVTKKIVYNVYYVKPFDWYPEDKRDSTIKFFSPYFQGMKIFLDPGHGGTDRKNKGPAGLAVEADINLKVALYLRDYLTKAGANVMMSRDKDTFITLDDRSRLANEWGADIFISIHHNAPGRPGDIYTNYTSTYYHAFPTDYEYDHSSHDIAKYVQRDLSYAMGNSGGLGSFDGTYSDYLIYPKAGFSVLRKTNSPRILVECAFHTSAYEEQRLIIDEFNQIQAWGIFRGLGRYLRQGIVKLSIPSDTISISKNKSIEIFIDDQNKGIDTTFYLAQIDTQNVNAKFVINKTQKKLVIPLDQTFKPNNCELKVVVRNVNGNHSFPFRRKIVVIK